jgi:hypothetical protein
MKSLPALFSFSDAMAYCGFSRTRLYSELHKLDIRKAGRRTLITRESLDHLIASLPRRQITAPKAKKAF